MVILYRFLIVYIIHNIEITDITYSSSLKITNNIDIANIVGCISSLFSIEQSNLKKGIIMRFKKVTNYSEMDSLEAFILDQYKKKLEADEIIEAIKRKFWIFSKYSSEQK